MKQSFTSRLMLFSSVLCLSIGAMTPGWGQEGKPLTLMELPKPTRAAPPPANMPTYKLSGSMTKFLPQAMYGTWSILATVISSTAPPAFYTPSNSELWTLERNGDAMTLQNIVTGAVASIEVDEASTDTATFHHEATSRSLKVIETPTLTVRGNHMSGTNRQEIFLLKNGRIMERYVLEIHIEGARLAGSKVTFSPNDSGPNLEVAPIQFQDR